MDDRWLFASKIDQYSRAFAEGKFCDQQIRLEIISNRDMYFFIPLIITALS